MITWTCIFSREEASGRSSLS